MQGCFQLKELALNFTYMTFAVNHDRDSKLLLKRKLNYLGTEALFQTEESEFATTAYHEKNASSGPAYVVDCINCLSYYFLAKQSEFVYGC